MANTFSGGFGLYIVDTATPSSTGIAVTSDTVVISKVRWVSATAVGDLLRITDLTGAQIFYQSVASGASYVEETNFNWLPFDKRTLAGFRVVTLTSGTVFIHKE